MAEAFIIIPARWASARFPGKPMATLRGAYGTPRSLLERSVIAARATGMPHAVATDDDRIAAEAERLGVRSIHTSQDCRNGTERVAEAVERGQIRASVIINLQGDAPLTPPEFVAPLLAALATDAGLAMATPVLRATPEALEALRADRAAGQVGGTTALRDRAGRALYFSKEVLPFGARSDTPVWHHVGLYAYRPESLARYAQLPAGTLELAEGLEQLRFLEAGLPVAAVEVASPQAGFWELNNPSDTARIEAALAARGID